jgi:oligopeptide/dipeptide ABC transporter ATP-binding protein
MPQASTDRADALYVIDGTVPTAAAMPTGCRFHPRCEYAIAECIDQAVELRTTASGVTRCLRSDELTLGAIR